MSTQEKRTLRKSRDTQKASFPPPPEATKKPLLFSRAVRRLGVYRYRPLILVTFGLFPGSAQCQVGTSSSKLSPDLHMYTPIPDGVTGNMTHKHTK